jgi:hypothetical protein
MLVFVTAGLCTKKFAGRPALMAFCRNVVLACRSLAASCGSGS